MCTTPRKWCKNGVKNGYFTVVSVVSVDHHHHPPTLRSVFFVLFLVVCLTPDNEHLCSETDFTQEKGDFHPITRIPKSIIPFSEWSVARGWPSFWQPQKGHEKCTFETLHNNEINCVFEYQRIKFQWKNITFAYGQDQGGWTQWAVFRRLPFLNGWIDTLKNLKSGQTCIWMAFHAI